MSFNPVIHPGVSETNGQGSNLNVKVSNLRVMNRNPLTDKQRAEADHHFKLHMLNVQTATPGYLVANRVLKDGSRLRIVSNGGMHQILVWPVGGNPRTKWKGIFLAVPSIPAGTFVRSDWDPKYSGAWLFEGETEPPEKLKKRREITDQEKVRQHPGNLTWWNEDIKANKKPIIVSWYGRATRYGRLDYYDRQRQWSIDSYYSNLFSPASSSTNVTPASFGSRSSWFSAFKPAVWINGFKHRTKTVADADVRVISAGLRLIDESTLELWIVSLDTTLAVYKGTVGNVTKSKDIEVEKQFDIPFTPTPTGYSGPLGADFNTYLAGWESLLQLPYFNASCTALAGLVSVLSGSAANPTASAAAPVVGTNLVALLMEVNLETQATTFTSGGAYTGTIDGVHSGGPTPFVTDEGYSESRTTERTYTFLSYGAVDYVGDQLTTVMVEYTRTDTFQEDGMGAFDTFGTDEHEKTMSGTTRTQYRVFRAHDDVTLVEKDSGVVNIGDITAEGLAVSASPTLTKQDFGTRTEDISADLFWAASVEGGDLRHNCVVVAEFVEVGESTFTMTWNNPASFGTDPRVRKDNTKGENKATENVVLSGGSRIPKMRMLFVKDEVVVTTVDSPTDAARASYSMFGLVAPENPTPTAPQWLPEQESNGINIDGFWSWSYQATGSFSDAGTIAGDLLPPFFPRQAGVAMGGIAGSRALSAHASCGRPYANYFAGTPNGDYLFWLIGGAARDGSTVADADWNLVGGWYIKDNAYEYEGELYHLTPSEVSVLAAPIFIYNAEELPA